ncbi:hypothetical protein QFC19_000044 [Naganishia cerealis]|uniref:Uncharacterized protein n=1 Tax=Naganishia cerealis TaxID=610337 RepID=A0ACC2WRY1_9TREE|nr:hypothetical protein QFC19_000044 [Naganishia cerealis]
MAALPPSSPAETPLPFTPTETPTLIAPNPSTIAFRAAVPHLLQPLAPQLSALYTARLRLLVDLPVGSSRGWCCTNCGWLREAYGWKVIKVKQEKGKKQVDTPTPSVKKGKAAGKARGKGKAQAGKADVTPDISIPTEALPLSDSNAPNSDSAKYPISPPAASASKIGAGARVPSANAVSRNRTKSTCPLCGSPISLRPSSTVTKSGYLSARRTKAIVDANGGDVSVLSTAGGKVGVAGTKRTRASMKEDEDKTTDPGSLQTTGFPLLLPTTHDPSSPPSSTSTTTSGKPLIPNPIKASPKLAFIPFTDPQPATEPLPPLVPSALPPPGEDRPAGVRNAVGFVNLGPVGGSAGKGRAGGGKTGRKQSSLKTSTVLSPLASTIGSSQRSPAATKPAPTNSSAIPLAAVKPVQPTTTGNTVPPAKKKQKTGLAKLLADNKAREKESEKKKSGGLLSLDGADWEL